MLCYIECVWWPMKATTAFEFSPKPRLFLLIAQQNILIQNWCDPGVTEGTAGRLCLLLPFCACIAVDSRWRP